MEPGGQDYLELRSRWLKLRSHLYDPNTGLPSLPAVLEEVRRRSEAGHRMGVLLLDLSGEESLEEVYGWETYDGVLRQIAEALESLRGSALDEEDIVAQPGIRSDQFILFLVLPDREAEAVLVRKRAEILDELETKLQIQVGKERPRGIMIHAEARVMPYDPTARIERSLYRAIDEVRAACRRDREEQVSLRLNELRRILSNRDILIRYQPIVRLTDDSIFGFEALSCGPRGDLFADPEMLFSFAEKTDQIIELERMCRLESVRGATQLPRSSKLFLNCSAHGIEDLEGVSDTLTREIEEAGLAVDDLVLEITERVAVPAWREFRKRLDRLRDRGFRIAIDDMGAGYSSLHSVAEIEPDFMKFDIALVRDIHRSAIKRGLLEGLRLVAEKVGARVIAEGVEQEEELETLQEMGVSYGQGYLFSPPSTFSLHMPE
ncbi:MAG: EAL domain-containing protein [Thermoanaerobaculia bacterium]|nr:EAL domain-containing protein [Thermoanaerobaculia bacterium]